MGDIKIIDNFLTKSYHNNILEFLTSPNFEWGYYDCISGPSGQGPMDHPRPPHFNEYGFSQLFWSSQNGPIKEFSPFLSPLLFQILDVTDCDFILRARADMVTWSKENFIHYAHTDFNVPNIASVFYVNESDGDTIFYNIKPGDVPKDKDLKNLKEYDRVTPKANRLVIFDGDLLHTGCSPTKHKNRILINSNYIKKETKEKISGK